jgi:hypothetical protein
MAITIDSTTDTPESVAEAFGTTVDQNPNDGADGANDDGAVDGSIDGVGAASAAAVADKGDGDGDKGGEPKAKTKTDGEGDGAPEGEHKKKLGGYQKKIQRLETENDLLVKVIKENKLIGSKTDENSDATTEIVNYCGEPEPQLADFRDQEDPHSAYLAAHTKWTRKEVTAQIKHENAEQLRQAVTQENESAFLTALNEDRAEGGIYHDYDAVLASIEENELDIPVTGYMKHAMDSARDDDGRSITHAMMYWLASHPDEAAKIHTLTPDKQLLAMGRIQVKADDDITSRRAEAEKAKAAKSKGKGKDSYNSGSSAGANGAGTGTTDTTNNQTDAGKGAGTKKVSRTPAPVSAVSGARTSNVSSTVDLDKIAKSGSFKDYEKTRLAQGQQYR